MTGWTPPPGARRFRCVDAHTAGEPLRVVAEGFPDLPGDTILAKRRFAREHHDDLRRALMLEPRGHADMYGCVLTEPVTDDGDVGVLFLHNEGWSTMCGHGIVGLVKVGLECGLLAPADEAAIRIDTPAGRVTATAHRGGDRVERVSFENVPSFVLRADCAVDVPGLGTVRGDLAFGGAFYLFVDAASVGVTVDAAHQRDAIDAGARIKAAAAAQLDVAHPDGDGDLGFLYGVILVAPDDDPAVHSRNVCVFADGEVDRCPTGTGVSARAAIHRARGELALGETITIASLIGTSFDVRAVRDTTVGDLAAVVPEVTGRAWVTGVNELYLDPGDPLRHGVLLR